LGNPNLDLTAYPDILLWNAHTEGPCEETPTTDTNFAGVDPGDGLEPRGDDLMEHPSFSRTGDSDTKFEENIRQPDFVILAKAVDRMMYFSTTEQWPYS